MSLIQIDPTGWLPDSLKQQIIDSVVTFVADQAKKMLGDEVSQALERLRSDAAFQDAVDRGLKEATDRFVREYTVEDADLVAAIARDPDFWKAESVREALLEIIRHPGVYLAEERMALAQSFADVLRQRVDRQRVDRAVTFYLRCVAESLWHLEPLRPVYELQLQRLSVERATEMVQELRGMRADVQGAMVALVQAIGQQQKLLPSPDRTVYHNLPQPDYGTFIGRQKELAQVHRILRPYPHSQHALVTIDGIGGIGKSALALEVAHRYLRDYDRLPEEERFEAIIWTSAKAAVLTANGIAPRQQITRTLDDIYTTISVALEREDITRARPEDQDELVTRALTQQRTLLIVDNLETVDDERVNAFLRELPAPTKAIVTTRHRIDVAYPVRLTGMPKEDGLALIAQECAKKGVTLSKTEAAKLYDRTGGVPLAIVWSVAQMGFGHPVEAVLRRLGQPSEDIARYCFEGTMERIRGKPAHKLLMALSLFATDASREALGYVADLPELDQDEGLVTLERLSLVKKKGSRFGMLPLTKTYAASELMEQRDFEQRARERWIEFLTTLIGRLEPATQEYYDHVEVETQNVFEATDWCLDHGRANEGAGLFRKVVRFLRMRGYWNETIRYLSHLLETRGIDQDSLAYFNWALGRIYTFQGEYGKAERHLRNALALAEKVDSDLYRARALRYLGSLYRLTGETQQARKSLEKGLFIAISTQDKVLTQGIHTLLAELDIDAGDYEQAEAHIQASLDLETQRVEEEPEKLALSQAIAYRLLGKIALAKEQYQSAKRHFEESLDASAKMGVEQDVAYAKKWIATTEERVGNYEKAVCSAQEAIDIFRRLGMRHNLAETEALLARLQGQYNGPLMTEQTG